ncbi:annexin B9-like isoform X1 [Diorhabda sublineata]|uniref:annexin B9-like isoform X1 n=1 Tax=Diorhabda sublineata TaxID=1163346 RepID=UPI0024E18125|nr:annexin B9-like isoform X1 [Diorhabda sublineata]
MAPTVFPWENFKADEDAQILKESLDGLGTNEDAIIEILAKRTNEQRRQIVTTYKTMFGEDLIEDLKSDLGGDFEDVILALLKDPLDYQVEELHKAVSGLGTDDDTLVEILVVHNNEEILQISERYQELYETSLEDDIKGDESGTLQRLLVSLSTGGRDESGLVNKSAAVADAQALYDAGESSWGTEESVFNSILCLKNPSQLKLIFDEYESLTGHSIEDAIDNEFSGSTKNAYLSLVSCMRDRATYLATRLHDAMAGMGTDDRTLIRIIVSRSEIDLEDIKEAYETKYSKSLYERVSGDSTGKYENILLAIIGY